MVPKRLCSGSAAGKTSATDTGGGRCSQKLNPDILLLQEVRDYDACVRLGEAVQPAAYTVVICSAFKGGKQEEAILAKIPAQAHPGSHGFPDATFDYFFGKNVKFGKPIITQSNVSDHLPVTCDAEF